MKAKRMEPISFPAQITKGAVRPFMLGGPLCLQVPYGFLGYVQHAMRGMSQGDEVLVTIQTGSHHSEKQRKYFHALVREWSRTMGEEFRKAKQRMKAEFGVHEPVRVNGQDYLWLKSTSTYTEDEYSALIQGTEHMLTEAGIDFTRAKVEYENG